jgi:hypothetical protein
MPPSSSEIAFDLHAGLTEYDVPELMELRLVGMAATLAIHIKGLAPIPIEVLRAVSGLYWGIQSYALDGALKILREAGFVRLIGTPRTETVVPEIPIFETVYGTLDDYVRSEVKLNEHEQTAIALLRELQDAPRNRDALFNEMRPEKAVFARTLEIGRVSGIISEHTARGRPILISPFYFADNLDGLADLAASHGASTIAQTLSNVKANQGWPLSLVRSRKSIGGVAITADELAVVEKLAAEGIIKPPTVAFGAKRESFVFTPQPGRTRLNASKKQIYERAMALISAVRKGQLMASRYPIRLPVALLRKLRDRGYVAANSEAELQYANLVTLLVGKLRPQGNGHVFELNKTPENTEALNLAIRLLSSGDMAGTEIDDGARLALTKDEKYIQSLQASRDLRRAPQAMQNKEVEHEFQLLLNL